MALLTLSTKYLRNFHIIKVHLSDIASRETNEPPRVTSRFHNRMRRNGSPYFNGQSDSTESEFTMDSDSSAHVSTYFLGRRAPPRRPQRRRNVVEVQEPQKSSRPWTRSFSKRR